MLVCLHAFWFWMFCKMIHKFIFTNVVEDKINTTEVLAELAEDKHLK